MRKRNPTEAKRSGDTARWSGNEDVKETSGMEDYSWLMRSDSEQLIWTSEARTMILCGT